MRSVVNNIYVGRCRQFRCRVIGLRVKHDIYVTWL